MTQSNPLHQIMTILGGSLSTNTVADTDYIVPAPTFDHTSAVQSLFAQLANETPGVIGSVLMNSAGDVLVTTLPTHFNVIQVAAISGPWLRIADKVAHSVGLGHSEESLIRTPEGFCSIRPIHSHIVITVLQSQSNLGFFWLNMAAIEQPLISVLAGIPLDRDALPY